MVNCWHYGVAHFLLFIIALNLPIRSRYVRLWFDNNEMACCQIFRQIRRREKWGGRWDSNPRRPGSQPGALPTELRPPRYIKLYRGLCRCCSTSLVLARPAGLEPATLGLAYQLPLSRPQHPPSLWSGLSLRRLRRRTYSLYGALRKSAAKFTPFCWPFLGASTLSDTFEPKSSGRR